MAISKSCSNHFVCSIGLALVFVALLAGCGGSGEGDNDNGQGSALINSALTYADFTLDMVTAQSCDELMLSATNGEPLDIIWVTGLPANFDAMAVYLEASGEGIGMLFPAGPVENRQAEFRIPPSPDFNPEGAITDLTITNGTYACPPLSFAIDPLPAAVGDYETYVEDLDDGLKHAIGLLAQSLGSDYSTLSNMPAAPENSLLPLYLAVQILETYFAELPAATPEEQDILLRLLQQAEVVDTLEDVIAELETWLVDHTSAITSLAPANSSALTRGTNAQQTLALVRAAGTDDCLHVPPPDISIDSTERLSDVMTGTLGKNMSTAFGGMATAMGFVSVALEPTGFLGSISDVAGVTATALKLGGDFIQGIYPSRFISLTFDVESPIYEDKDLPRSKWDNAQARVASTGFSISRAADEFALAAAGMSPVGGFLISGASSTASTLFADEVDAAFESLGNNLGCIRTDSQTWGPFDVNAPRYVKETYTGTSITRMLRDEYVPARIGQSTIQLDILGQAFGGATIGASRPVTVEAKTITISPRNAVVTNPADPVELIVRIDAYKPELYNPTLLPGGNLPSPPDFTKLEDGLYRVIVTTSTEEKDFPMLFKVASTSQVLPPEQPAREDFVKIHLGSAIEIAPPPGCIPVGETADLEAILSGFTNPESRMVTWNASAGSITPKDPTRLATYQAPNAPGTYTISAETPALSSSAPPLTDEIQVTVSTACVRQFFTAVASSEVNGDVGCGDPYTLERDEEEDSIEEYFTMHTPMPTGDYWYNRDESISTAALLTSNVEVSRNEQSICESIPMRTNANVNISSKADGTASWDANFYSIGACVLDDYSNQDGRLCDAGVSTYGLQHFLYLPVQEAGNYRFTVDMRCEVPPNYGELQIQVYRYIDGEGAPQPPNGLGSFPTPGVPPTVPYISSGQFLPFSCNGETQSQSFTMELTGPLGSTGTDLVTISYQGTPTGVFTDDTTTFDPGPPPVTIWDPRIQENMDALDIYKNGDVPEFDHSMSVSTRLERLD